MRRGIGAIIGLLISVILIAFPAQSLGNHLADMRIADNNHAVPSATGTANNQSVVAKSYGPKVAKTPFAAPQPRSRALVPYSFDESTEGNDNQSGTVTTSSQLQGLATVGVTWKQQNMSDVDKAPTLRLRFLRDGVWSSWVTMSAFDDDSGIMGASSPYYAGKASDVEAELTPVSGQKIESAALVSVDPGYSTSTVSNSVFDESQSPVARSAVLQDTQISAVRTASANTGAGVIHTREQWWVSGNPAMSWKPDRTAHWQGAVIHHTVGTNDYSQQEVPAIINGIYVYHNTTNHWGDIGYNLLVDRFGGIWEGRDEGVPNPVVQASEVIGAHTMSFNSATFGVAMLGNFQGDTSPSDAQFKATAAAIAWEFNGLHIGTAQDTFDYYGKQPRVTGHGDASHHIAQAGGKDNTACPGNQVWNRMGYIRNLVDGYLHDVTHLPLVSVPDGNYFINSFAKDSSSIDIPGGSTSNGAATQLYQYNGSAAQQYRFARQSNGSYVIMNVHSGKVLDVQNGAADNSVTVQQWEPNGTVAQQWYLHDSGAGFYIQSALGNWVLDLAGGSVSNGTSARLYAPNGTVAQKYLVSSAKTNIPTGTSVKVASALNSGLVLDLSGGSQASGTRMQLYPWNQTNAQLYTFRQVGNGVYEILVRASNKVVEVAGATTANNGVVQQWEPNNTAAQHWSVVSSGESSLMLVNDASGKVMDVPGAAAQSGTKIQSYALNGTVAQQWTVTPANNARDELDNFAFAHRSDLPNGTINIGTSLTSSLVLDVAGGSTANSAQVRLWSSNGTNAQRWVVSHDQHGYVTFTNAGSKKSLDVSGGSSANGATIQQYAANGTYAQKWVAVKGSDNTLTLYSAVRLGQVLDVAGASTSNGSRVQLYASNNTAAQHWIVR